VPIKNAPKGMAGLKGATVCVEKGTTSIQNLVDYSGTGAWAGAACRSQDGALKRPGLCVAALSVLAGMIRPVRLGENLPARVAPPAGGDHRRIPGVLVIYTMKVDPSTR